MRKAAWLCLLLLLFGSARALAAALPLGAGPAYGATARHSLAIPNKPNDRIGSAASGQWLVSLSSSFGETLGEPCGRWADELCAMTTFRLAKENGRWKMAVRVRRTEAFCLSLSPSFDPRLVCGGAVVLRGPALARALRAAKTCWIRRGDDIAEAMALLLEALAEAVAGEARPLLRLTFRPLPEGAPSRSLPKALPTETPWPRALALYMRAVAAQEPCA